MLIKGLYFDGKLSRSITATISLGADGSVQLNADNEIKTASFENVKFSSRIGNSPRFIVFKDGSKFETENNDAIDDCLAVLNKNQAGFAHKLESSLPFVIPAVLIVIVFVCGFLQYGIPWTAKQLAYYLPFETTAFIGDKTLEQMEKRYFETSKLSADRMQTLQARFDSLVKNANSTYKYKLLFRSSESIGANAFALPSGTVIITDQLVELANNDEQLLSILAHEVGHVELRHGLKHVIQSSMLSFIILWITGILVVHQRL